MTDDQLAARLAALEATNDRLAERIYMLSRRVEVLEAELKSKGKKP
jgi:uncharacterized protein involved in exopolysaccharide biosynthesis